MSIGQGKIGRIGRRIGQRSRQRTVAGIGHRVRRAAVVGGVASALSLVLVTAGPAAAIAPSTWPRPPAISLLHALLLFAGVPLALAVGISLLVMVPSLASGPRYRPGLSWWAKPEWFNGPEQGLKALDTADRPALSASMAAEARDATPGAEKRPLPRSSEFQTPPGEPGLVVGDRPGEVVHRPVDTVGGGASASW